MFVLGQQLLLPVNLYPDIVVTFIMSYNSYCLTVSSRIHLGVSLSSPPLFQGTGFFFILALNSLAIHSTLFSTPTLTQARSSRPHSLRQTVPVQSSGQYGRNISRMVLCFSQPTRHLEIHERTRRGVGLETSAKKGRAQAGMSELSQYNIVIQPNDLHSYQ
jgi:hypothetical protein